MMESATARQPFGVIVVIKRDGTDGGRFELVTQSCLFGRYSLWENTFLEFMKQRLATTFAMSSAIERLRAKTCEEGCDVRIQLPSVRPQHCRIEVDLADEKLYIVNLAGEDAPTRLNGSVIHARTGLSHKDIFTIGDRSFRCEVPDSVSILQADSDGFSSQKLVSKTPARAQQIGLVDVNKTTSRFSRAVMEAPRSPARMVPKSPSRVATQSPSRIAPQSPSRMAPPSPSRKASPSRIAYQSPSRVAPQSPSRGAPQSPARVAPQSPSRMASASVFQLMNEELTRSPIRSVSPARSPARIGTKNAVNDHLGTIISAGISPSSFFARKPSEYESTKKSPGRVVNTLIAGLKTPAQIGSTPKISAVRSVDRNRQTVVSSVTTTHSVVKVSTMTYSPSRTDTKKTPNIKLKTPMSVSAGRLPQGRLMKATPQGSASVNRSMTANKSDGRRGMGDAGAVGELGAYKRKSRSESVVNRKSLTGTTEKQVDVMPVDSPKTRNVQSSKTDSEKAKSQSVKKAKGLSPSPKVNGVPVSSPAKGVVRSPSSEKEKAKTEKTTPKNTPKNKKTPSLNTVISSQTESDSSRSSATRLRRSQTQSPAIGERSASAKKGAKKLQNLNLSDAVLELSKKLMVSHTPASKSRSKSYSVPSASPPPRTQSPTKVQSSDNKINTVSETRRSRATERRSVASVKQASNQKTSSKNEAFEFRSAPGSKRKDSLNVSDLMSTFVISPRCKADNPSVSLNVSSKSESRVTDSSKKKTMRKSNASGLKMSSLDNSLSGEDCLDDDDSSPEETWSSIVGSLDIKLTPAQKTYAAHARRSRDLNSSQKKGRVGTPIVTPASKKSFSKKVGKDISESKAATKQTDVGLTPGFSSNPLARRSIARQSMSSVSTTPHSPMDVSYNDSPGYDSVTTGSRKNSVSAKKSSGRVESVKRNKSSNFIVSGNTETPKSKGKHSLADTATPSDRISSSRSSSVVSKRGKYPRTSSSSTVVNNNPNISMNNSNILTSSIKASNVEPNNSFARRASSLTTPASANRRSSSTAGSPLFSQSLNESVDSPRCSSYLIESIDAVNASSTTYKSTSLRRSESQLILSNKSIRDLVDMNFSTSNPMSSNLKKSAGSFGRKKSNSGIDVSYQVPSISSTTESPSLSEKAREMLGKQFMASTPQLISSVSKSVTRVETNNPDKYSLFSPLENVTRLMGRRNSKNECETPVGVLFNSPLTRPPLRGSSVDNLSSTSIVSLSSPKGSGNDTRRSVTDTPSSSDSSFMMKSTTKPLESSVISSSPQVQIADAMRRGRSTGNNSINTPGEKSSKSSEKISAGSKSRSSRGDAQLSKSVNASKSMTKELRRSSFASSIFSSQNDMFGTSSPNTAARGRGGRRSVSQENSPSASALLADNSIKRKTRDASRGSKVAKKSTSLIKWSSDVSLDQTPSSQPLSATSPACNISLSFVNSRSPAGWSMIRPSLSTSPGYELSAQASPPLSSRAHRSTKDESRHIPSVAEMKSIFSEIRRRSVSLPEQSEPHEDVNKSTTMNNSFTVGPRIPTSPRGTKRPGSPLKVGPPRSKRNVSFGPTMSPELFDHMLPPCTPLKRGGAATPRRQSAGDFGASPMAPKSLLKKRLTSSVITITEEAGPGTSGKNQSPVQRLQSKDTSPWPLVGSPSEKSVTLTGKNVTPARKSVTPSMKNVTPVGKTTASSVKNATPSQKSTSDGKNVSPAGKNVTPIGMTTTSSVKKVSSSQKSTTPSGKNATSSGKSVTPSQTSATPGMNSTPSVKIVSPKMSETSFGKSSTKSVESVSLKKGSLSGKSPEKIITPSARSEIPSGNSAIRSGKRGRPSGKTVSQEKRASPSGKSTTPSASSRTPSGRSVSLENSLILSERSVTRTDRSISPEKSVTPTGKNRTPSAKGATSSAQKSSPSEKSVTPVGQKITSPGKKITSSEKKTSSPEKSVSSSEKSTNSTKKIVTPKSPLMVLPSSETKNKLKSVTKSKFSPRSAGTSPAVAVISSKVSPRTPKGKLSPKSPLLISPLAKEAVISKANSSKRSESSKNRVVTSLLGGELTITKRRSSTGRKSLIKTTDSSLKPTKLEQIHNTATITTHNVSDSPAISSERKVRGSPNINNLSISMTSPSSTKTSSTKRSGRTSIDPYIFESSPESAIRERLSRSFVPLTPLAQLDFSLRYSTGERVKQSEEMQQKNISQHRRESLSVTKKIKSSKSFGDFKESSTNSSAKSVDVSKEKSKDTSQNVTISPRLKSPLASPSTISPTKSSSIKLPKNVSSKRTSISSPNFKSRGSPSSALDHTSEASKNSPRTSNSSAQRSPKVISASPQRTPVISGRKSDASRVGEIADSGKSRTSTPAAAKRINTSPVRITQPSPNELDVSSSSSNRSSSKLKRSWDSEPRGRVTSSRSIHKPERWSPEFNKMRVAGKMISERNVDISSITTSPAKFYSNKRIVPAGEPVSSPVRGILHNAVAVRAIYGKAALTPLAGLSASQRRDLQSNVSKDSLVEPQATKELDCSGTIVSQRKVKDSGRKSTSRKSSGVVGLGEKSAEGKVSEKPVLSGKKRLWSEVVKTSIATEGGVVVKKNIVSKIVKKKKTAALKTPKAHGSRKAGAHHVDSPVTLVIGRAKKLTSGSPLNQITRRSSSSSQSLSDSMYSVLPFTPDGPGEMLVSPMTNKSYRSRKSTPVVSAKRKRLVVDSLDDSLNLTSEQTLEDLPQDLSIVVGSSGARLVERSSKQSFSSKVNRIHQKRTSTKVLKSPKLGGIRALVKTPKVQNSPKLGGIRQLVKTPKVQGSPRLAGVRELVKTPGIQNSPKLGGVKELVKTPKVQKSPKLRGVRELVKTPKVVKSPKVEAIRLLVKTPKAQKTPDLSGLKRLMERRKSEMSPQFEGVEELMRTPKSKKNKQDLNSVEAFEDLECTVDLTNKKGPVRTSVVVKDVQSKDERMNQLHLVLTPVQLTQRRKSVKKNKTPVVTNNTNEIQVVARSLKKGKTPMKDGRLSTAKISSTKKKIEAVPSIKSSRAKKLKLDHEVVDAGRFDVDLRDSSLDSRPLSTVAVHPTTKSRGRPKQLKVNDEGEKPKEIVRTEESNKIRRGTSSRDVEVVVPVESVFKILTPVMYARGGRRAKVIVTENAIRSVQKTTKITKSTKQATVSKDIVDEMKSARNMKSAIPVELKNKSPTKAQKFSVPIKAIVTDSSIADEQLEDIPSVLTPKVTRRGKRIDVVKGSEKKKGVHASSPVNRIVSKSSEKGRKNLRKKHEAEAIAPSPTIASKPKQKNVVVEKPIIVDEVREKVTKTSKKVISESPKETRKGKKLNFEPEPAVTVDIPSKSRKTSKVTARVEMDIVNVSSSSSPKVTRTGRKNVAKQVSLLSKDISHEEMGLTILAGVSKSPVAPIAAKSAKKTKSQSHLSTTPNKVLSSKVLPKSPKGRRAKVQIPEVKQSSPKGGPTLEQVPEATRKGRRNTDLKQADTSRVTTMANVPEVKMTRKGKSNTDTQQPGVSKMSSAKKSEVALDTAVQQSSPVKSPVKGRRGAKVKSLTVSPQSKVSTAKKSKVSSDKAVQQSSPVKSPVKGRRGAKVRSLTVSTQGKVSTAKKSEVALGKAVQQSSPVKSPVKGRRGAKATSLTVSLQAQPSRKRKVADIVPIAEVIPSKVSRIRKEVTSVDNTKAYSVNDVNPGTKGHVGKRAAAAMSTNKVKSLPSSLVEAPKSMEVKKTSKIVKNSKDEPKENVGAKRTAMQTSDSNVKAKTAKVSQAISSGSTPKRKTRSAK